MIQRWDVIFIQDILIKRQICFVTFKLNLSKIPANDKASSIYRMLSMC